MTRVPSYLRMGLIDALTLTVVSPNVVTYSVLIDGLCKEGKFDNAKRLFYEMFKKTYTPMLSHTMCLLMV